MKKISFRSILFRPSYCARPIRSHYFKPLCYRWNRPILSAALTMETNRKPSRIVIRKYGESHQEPCSGSRPTSVAPSSVDLVLLEALHPTGQDVRRVLDDLVASWPAPWKE